MVSAILVAPLTLYANDIYIKQVGDTLNLDIVQDGQNNTIGTSIQDVVLGSSSGASDDMTFSITQTGNTNVITAQILGSTYTGTWDITGNSNNIDFNCDSGGSNSSCATATANITWTGSSQDIDLDIGETSSASTATVNITGASGSDSNVIAATIDGNSAVLTLTVNGDSNNYLIDIDGNGDSIGHTLIHSHTGDTADVDIVQSGVNDNMLNLTTVGNGHDIDITQRD